MINFSNFENKIKEEKKILKKNFGKMKLKKIIEKRIMKNSLYKKVNFSKDFLNISKKNILSDLKDNKENEKWKKKFQKKKKKKILKKNINKKKK